MKFLIMGKEKQGSHGWQVWLAIWSGSIASLIAILLYVFLLDIDPPAIKPRSGVENSAAAIVYIAHCGNIVAGFVIAFILMATEPAQLKRLPTNLLFDPRNEYTEFQIDTPDGLASYINYRDIKIRREEHGLMMVYFIWELLYCLLVLILIPLSCVTVLKHVPGRIILHVICILIAIWNIFHIFQIYRNRDRYDWNPRPQGKQQQQPRQPLPDYNGQNNRMAGETGML